MDDFNLHASKVEFIKSVSLFSPHQKSMVSQDKIENSDFLFKWVLNTLLEKGSTCPLLN